MEKKPGSKDSKFQKPKPNIIKRNIDNAKFSRSKSKEVLGDKEQNRARTVSQNSKSKNQIQNHKKTGQTKPTQKKIPSQKEFESMKSPVLVDKISQPRGKNLKQRITPEAKNVMAKAEEIPKVEEIPKLEEIHKVEEIPKVEEILKVQEMTTATIEKALDTTVKAIDTIENSYVDTMSSEENIPYAKGETPLKIGKVKASEVVLSSLKRRRNSNEFSDTMEKASKKSL
ncbi:hypothetical protein SteCoe_31923 [Stentor coeruleus]|uniref:Uncharacterized protein n=1 Tax=Stentor coeruleus TaxID=5963 RepID=A0A1R2B0C9_9CILI|nr:hypothetical protein SteCoe_31923 [Stentor coeruleus]